MNLKNVDLKILFGEKTGNKDFQNIFLELFNSTVLQLRIPRFKLKIYFCPNEISNFRSWEDGADYRTSISTLPQNRFASG